MNDREGGQQRHAGVFGAAESLTVVASLLCVHCHAVAGPPCLGSLLHVLLFRDVGRCGLAVCLSSVGKVVSAPLMLRAGGCGDGRGRETRWAVVWEVQVHVCGLVLSLALSNWVSAGLR